MNIVSLAMNSVKMFVLFSFNLKNFSIIFYLFFILVYHINKKSKLFSLLISYRYIYCLLDLFLFPLNVTYGIGIEEHDKEGRVITAEYENFYLVTVFTPNSQRELARLDYRMVWEDVFRAYLLELDKKKPVIVCGDLNVAAEEIDLKNPKTNRKNAGFTDEERAKFRELKAAGFVDTFRHLHPEEVKYSWWSYMFKAREKNAGWRIDYFVVSERIADKVQAAEIHTEILGSDHCPVSIEIDL